MFFFQATISQEKKREPKKVLLGAIRGGQRANCDNNGQTYGRTTSLVENYALLWRRFKG